MSLPSYKQATTNPMIIELVAPYLEPNQLAIASRVCRKWSNICSVILWCAPLETLARKNRPYSTTVDFFDFALSSRVPESQRLQLRRSQVHVLDFRRLVSAKPAETSSAWAQAKGQDFISNEQVLNGFWIFDRIADFPNLRYLVLDGIDDWEQTASFLRHASPLFAQDSGSSVRTPLIGGPSVSTSAAGPSILKTPAQVVNNGFFHNPGTKNPLTQVRPFLLSFTGPCRITGMEMVLSGFFTLESLHYLDISHTTTSETWAKAFQLKAILPNIRVLKLCDLRLTNGLLPECILSSHCCLWSLDIRHNFLDDQVLEVLHTKCFAPNFPKPAEDAYLYELPPTYDRYDQLPVDVLGPIILRSDTKEAFLKPSLLHGIDSHDPLLYLTGLTHLYLSNNKFTAEGIEAILRHSNRLQVLDIGTVRTSFGPYLHIPEHPNRCTIWGQNHARTLIKREFSPVLASLRIHHSIVTLVPTITAKTSDLVPSSYKLDYLKQAEVLGQNLRSKGITSFIPMDNCSIKCLILTGIPTKSYGFTIGRLKNFLRAASDQEKYLTGIQGGTSRRAPQLLKGLKTLKLEFLPEDSSSPLSPIGGSISGDRDADAFLEESMGDFSFFEGEKENESRRGSVITPVSTGGSSSWGGAESGEELVLDVVEELKRFRRKSGERWGGKLVLLSPLGG